MDPIYRVTVSPRQDGAQDQGAAGQQGSLADIAALGIDSVDAVVSADLYFLKGDLSDRDVEIICSELLVDPIVQKAQWQQADEPLPDLCEAAARIEVGLYKGVSDSVAENLMDRAELLEINGLEAASTAQSYLLYGDPTEEELHRIARQLLCNDVIQYYALGALEPHLGEERETAEIKTRRVAIRDLDDAALMALSKRRLLSLDLTEMHTIQNYYRRQGRDPTDVELESLAQTWSEHCVHKTFKAIIDYTEQGPDGVKQERIDSLIRTYLQAATREIDAPWVRSAFVDNAGIIDYDGDYAISFKVETHNHPSALEPFGGANTGIGGVVRDVIGVSARPIANTDVLCFGPLETSFDQLPNGVLHPQRIYNGVIAGVEDYGNKMGIPTVNGGICFDPGYTANPLVYCGCLGIAPVGAHRREARPGDLVVVLGGRTGRDGLHGATFSSIELTEDTGETSGGAVQIGMPITEKMMLDAILVARDEGLYDAITDCGAGGLSSAVSEMGEDVGVTVHLERVPLKYVGLQPWEIWLSEAQERMVLAIPPQHEARLCEICQGYSVEMTVIGTFGDDRELHLYYEDDLVGDLSMQFLHDGLPRKRLEAIWTAPAQGSEQPAYPEDGGALAEALLDVLAHSNIRSKEHVVRLYDHEVQGGTVVKPFVGQSNSGPSDAAVLKPLEVEDSCQGVALGAAFNPAYGAVDPYAMAVSAIDEAVRNVVAVGADPKRIAILDNFCWGNPALPDRLGGLVRALKGCHAGALHYGTPFISGKDSLNNEYRDGETGELVAIPPSLLISAVGVVPDVRHTCTSDLKQAGERLYLLGETRAELGASYLHRVLGQEGGQLPGLAERGPAIARALHAAIAGDLVSACHDCSEGGLAVAAAEMMLDSSLGLSLFLSNLTDGADPELDEAVGLFSESNGRYLVTVSERDADAFEDCMRDLPCTLLGQVIAAPELIVHRIADDEPLFVLPASALGRAWRGHVAGESATS